MADNDLPVEVRDLIARHLETMEHVDALLVLHRAPDRGWTADEVATELRIAPKGLVKTLADLEKSGLVERDAAREGAYRYAPATSLLARSVEALLQAYNQRPVTLVKAIYSRPPSAVRSFADAFRLRTEE